MPAVRSNVVPRKPLIFPATGGAPIFTHLHPRTWLRWTGDGKHLILCSLHQVTDKSYVLPLASGQPLPASLATLENSPSVSDFARLPGVRIIPVGDVVPGPTADIYAFTRETVQRNVYRIPLP